MASPQGSLRRSMQIIETVSTPRQHGVQCDPCKNEGKQRNAVQFCQQCRQNMCKSCVEQHAKFLTTKHHNLIRKLETNLKNLNLIVETCRVHSGKLLDMFCGRHDEVCCAVCVAVNHRNCDDVVYIPEAAKDIEKSLEYQRQRNKLTSLRNMFSHMKKSRERFIASIEQQKETIFTQMRAYKMELIRMMDDIEKRATQDVDKFYQKEETVSRNGILVCDDLLALIDSVTDKFKETAAQGNAPKLFVQMKLSNRQYKQFSAAADSVLSRKPKRLLYKTSTMLQKDLQESSALGELKVRVTPEFVGREFSAQLKSDDRVCDIQGSAVMPGGKFLLADFANRRLKMVDATYNCRPLFTFNSGPTSVSRVTNDDVIVSLPQEWQVAIFNVPTASARYKLTMDAKAVSSDGEKMFVLESTHILDSNKIMVPSLRLNMMTWESQGPTEQTCWVLSRSLIDPAYFPNPTGMSVGPKPNVVHIVDQHAGILSVKMRRDKLEVKQFTDKNLVEPFGIDHDVTGDLFVTGRSSNNVMRLSRDGTRLMVLLSEADGLKRPQAVSFDDINQRILVGMQNSNTVLVFNIGFDPYGHFWEKELMFRAPRRPANDPSKDLM